MPLIPVSQCALETDGGEGSNDHRPTTGQVDAVPVRLTQRRARETREMRQHVA